MISVHSLPFELLAGILEAVHDAATSALTGTWSGSDKFDMAAHALAMISSLSALHNVSHAWRSIVLTTPKLWSIIPALNLLDSPFSVEDFIARSAAVPVTLLVDIACSKITRVALGALGNAKAFGRVQHLSIVLSGRGNDSPICDKNLRLLHKHPMPALQHLSYCDGVLNLLPDGWAWLKRHAEQLCFLSLEMVDVVHCYHIPSEDNGALPLHGLELLRLHVARWEGLRTLLLGPFVSLKELQLGSENGRYRAYTSITTLQDTDRDIAVLLRVCPKIERLVVYEYIPFTLTFVLTALSTPPLPLTNLGDIILHQGTIQRNEFQRFLDARGTLSVHGGQTVVLDQVRLLGRTEPPLRTAKGINLRVIHKSGVVEAEQERL